MNPNRVPSLARRARALISAEAALDFDELDQLLLTECAALSLNWPPSCDASTAGSGAPMTPWHASRRGRRETRRLAARSDRLNAQRSKLAELIAALRERRNRHTQRPFRPPLTSSPPAAMIPHIEQSNGGSISSQDTAPVRVAVVDDHGLFRCGVCDLLSEHGFEVVGEASTGEEAIKQAAEQIPDVILMDISMPGIGGIEATRRIRTDSPHTRVVVLTISADEDDVGEAILAGASGYLLKDASIEAIVSGVTAAARGEALLSPAIAGRLLDRMRADELLSELPPEAHLRLTDREREVLRLMASGQDNPQIAQELFISVATVKNHVGNVLAKLEVENRLQAAVYAVRRGLV